MSICLSVSPKIISPTQSVRVSSGGVASIDCLATGSPRPSVSWHHGNILLERDDRHSILANGTLLLYEAKTSDQGSYTCTATNIMGTVEQLNLLLVDGWTDGFSHHTIQFLYVLNQIPLIVFLIFLVNLIKFILRHKKITQLQRLKWRVTKINIKKGK